MSLFSILWLGIHIRATSYCNSTVRAHQDPVELKRRGYAGVLMYLDGLMLQMWYDGGAGSTVVEFL